MATTANAPATRPATTPATSPAMIDPAVLRRAARVIRVLGHPLRLRLLEALERGELCVADLQEMTRTNQAVVSQHLGVLRANGVVEARREGPRVYYRIVEAKVSRILACIRECDLPDLVDLDLFRDLPDLADLVPVESGGGAG